MYDAFSSDYDRFVNWSTRLSAEMPFIERRLRSLGAVKVLDAACGTGMHVIALALRGYQTAGADLSGGMVEQAQRNSRLSGVKARFEVAGFGELEKTFSLPEKSTGKVKIPFDALFCLGNSLPHLLTIDELQAALLDFARCLRPGGLLLLQNRNFDAIVSNQDRWMEPQHHREGENEWLFLRFYDFKPDGLIDFNIMTLKKEGEATWRQQVSTTQLRPLLQSELTTVLKKTGFSDIACYGDMAGSLYHPKTSGNLVISARRNEQL